jgi:hypothetical protein
MIYFLGGLTASILLVVIGRLTGTLSRALIVRASVGVVAAGVLLLCQPWGFVFWLEPFRVDPENPFWSKVRALCLDLYGHSFGLLVLGMLWFVISVHFPKPGEKR